MSEPTARKYARMEDLSPEPPRRRKPESEVLAPYEGTIDSWLDDDCRNWRKQRHTAVRVYVRLRDELGYDGSYSTVQRYVRRRREEMARERDRRDAEGFLTLNWLPGEVQVDFGEADFRVRGVVTRGRYLTVTFPHSNVGLTQVFCVEVKIDFTRLDSEPPPSAPTYIRQSRHCGAPESAAAAGEALSCGARSLVL